MGLWDFALDYYRRAGVSEACLAMQDLGGVDVNVLIYLLWRVAIRAERIPDTALAEADAVVAEWRVEVVQPLRAVRRRLKSGPLPAPNPATETLRGRLKAAELEAEHIELDTLEGLASASPAPAAGERQVEARRALELLVAHYGQGRAADMRPAIEALLRAL